MTEKNIKKIVKDTLEKDKYLVWYPPVSRFAPKFKYCDEQHSAKDIFTIFDCLALKDSEIRFIQYTSQKNMKAREKKIMDFYDKWDVFLPAEVWGVESKTNIKIIYI
jgi:hypothetical protein